MDTGPKAARDDHRKTMPDTRAHQHSIPGGLMSKHNRALHYGVAILLAAAIGTARADVTPPSAAAKPSEPEDQLEEVVVSAQKRLESIQDVPVPVTALGA